MKRGEIIPSVTGASRTGALPLTSTGVAEVRVSPPYHWATKRLMGEQPRYSTRYAPRGSPAMMNRPSGLVNVLCVASAPLATTHTLASGAPLGPRTRPMMAPRWLRNALSRLARSRAMRCAGVGAGAACSARVAPLAARNGLAVAGRAVRPKPTTALVTARV